MSAADSLEFTPGYDMPVPYMKRLTDYYLALGYGNPYRWAHFADVPFTPVTKPLAESRVALVTTAAPHKEGAGDQGPGAPYNAAAKFYEVYVDSSDSHAFRGVSHVGIDRKYTTAEDVNSFFPLRAMREAAASGRIGKLAPRFCGTPTNRSQVTTIDQDCRDIYAILQEDEVDLAILVAN
jgi:D-proline reductase (dithiol) PrdB